MAQVMTVPPNVKYADLFVKLQREAREAGKGLWAEGGASSGAGSAGAATAAAGGDCIKRYYLMQGLTVEEEDLFQQKFPDLLWEHLRRLVRNFAALPVWVNRSPTISSAVFGGKQTYEFWKHIFDTGTTPSGLNVLAQGVNLDRLLV